MDTDTMRRLRFACREPLSPTRRGYLLVVVLFVVGCGGGAKGPDLVPVQGVVTLDGKALSGATVTLIPQGTTMGQAAMGRTDAAGAFDLVSVDKQQKGAAVGAYRVLISKKVNPDGTDFMPKPDDDPMLASYKEILPPVFSDEAKSTLTADVPAGGAKLDFKLDSKKR